MSLLNVKHLVTPFQNWVHLILIVLMAFLFAAYRWAGGRIEIRPLDPTAIQRSVPERAPAARGSTESAARPRPAEPKGDLLKDFAQRTAPADRPAEQRDNGALSDLERQLGLK